MDIVLSIHAFQIQKNLTDSIKSNVESVNKKFLTDLCFYYNCRLFNDAFSS
jgi:hypothetical protein